ncbi:hypothetical protein B0H66DRAFT_463929, partial [Apodospora peruviana]
ETKQRKPGKVGRALNTFFLYRKAHMARAMELTHTQFPKGHPRRTMQMILKVVAESWRLEPRAVRDSFQKLAAIETKNHQLAFPTYKYNPRTKGTKR